jgi:hypothetical protein
MRRRNCRYLWCTSDVLRPARRQPHVADRFGGQDQAPPEGSSITPERIERLIFVVSVFQA